MESMRVFPPIWAIERTPIEDDVIGGYHIPKGSIVTLCIYQIHRNESDWENPEGFDPERFTTENSATRHNYSYIPFGGGPRTCIGNSFAMMEATLILAYISSLYDLRLVSGQNIQMDPMITLRPKNGIFMKVFPNQ
jgi:cytochrome P450